MIGSFQQLANVMRNFAKYAAVNSRHHNDQQALVRCYKVFRVQASQLVHITKKVFSTK